MTYDFKGKVVLITGGDSGIGLSAAEAFAKAGASVALTGTKDDKAQDAARKITDEGGKAIGFAADVTSDAAVDEMIARTVKEFGRLDVAFNNAGVISRHIETSELPGDEWDRVIAINLRGAFRCMQAEIQKMLKQGDGGSIINCASIGGLRGVAGLPAYIASKHGLIGLTKAAALEVCKKGIRVNAVCPGQIDTPMNDWLTGGDKEKTAEMIEQTQPIGRLGKPEEIASAVLWLASPGAAFTIGAAIPVDGGQSAW